MTESRETEEGASECDTALDEVLAHCFEWNFPIFELRDLTSEVLSRLAYRFFDLEKLFSHYKLHREKFLAYFRYRRRNTRSLIFSPLYIPLYSADEHTERVTFTAGEIFIP